MTTNSVFKNGFKTFAKSHARWLGLCYRDPASLHTRVIIRLLTLTTLNPSTSIPLYWKILADSGYLHIEHVADFDGFRISIVFNCLVMLVDGL